MTKYFLFVVVLITSCGKQEDVYHAGPDAVFKRLDASETGIDFVNLVETTDELDVFRYRNFYNGGGVGIGDFNNDGLPEVFLISNVGPNKLFLNKGGWKFEDISASAGIQGTKAWSTGVSIVDVNGDGFLDIYVSNAGDVMHGNRENELFINQGNLTFLESAAQYGLADKGFGTHAAFFDYDKDGDLDCYVLNNSYKPVSSLGYRNLRKVRDPFGGHKLYRNDGDKFVDVSEAAGIFGSVIGFGLGVSVSDVNRDTWPDLYISNDFYERDYLYINKGDGSFEEMLESAMDHVSMFSMGGDIADLNNDGYPEIFSTDMLPEDKIRLKTLTAFETYDIYQLRTKNGYYHQFMRNMLHLNNRDGTFTEIGELAGVSATDWSWGALIADFNNDQNKEIFVSNGIYKDLINQDFVEYLGSSDQMRMAIEGREINFEEFTKKMPSQKLSNFLFEQTDHLKFTNVSEEWGLAEPGFSNGAAYGDLDNDGDLDLVVNNVNHEVFIYKNQTQELTDNNYLAFKFKGHGKNVFGLGATVHAYVDSSVISLDNMPTRGFQSSMDYKMIMGVGDLNKIDCVTVTWPDQRIQVLRDVQTNQLHTFSSEDAKVGAQQERSGEPLLRMVENSPIIHEENIYNDFARDRLQYHMLSTQGPAFAKGDVNNDGLDDLFVGASVGHTSMIYLQTSGGKFIPLDPELFETDSTSEDVAAIFFDADGDSDLDLYVATGGSEHLEKSPAQIDRFYINEGVRNGKPAFEKMQDALPSRHQSGSCVRVADIDNDGDLDLFVGTRSIPSAYGMPADQVILINNGNGKFSDATGTIAPALLKFGMVTDAAWFDYDQNGFPDLMVVGEWMPVTIFSNDGKKLSRVEGLRGLSKSDGWWNTIKAADIDQDGDTDFVLGNLGLNSLFRPSAEEPMVLYVNDFDKNGSVEPIFAFTRGDKEYPYALRQDIIQQISVLKKEFVFYKDYADKQVQQIFETSSLAEAHQLRFYEPYTSILINDGAKGFRLQHLPVEAQFAPVYGVEIFDVDGDNLEDIILGGNLFAVKPQVGRYDAMKGLVLQNQGNGNFKPLPAQESGLKIGGEIRHISVVRRSDQKTLIFVRNNDSAKFYRMVRRP
jgi:hypothetical protein